MRSSKLSFAGAQLLLQFLVPLFSFCAVGMGNLELFVQDRVGIILLSNTRLHFRDGGLGSYQTVTSGEQIALAGAQLLLKLPETLLGLGALRQRCLQLLLSGREGCVPLFQA